MPIANPTAPADSRRMRWRAALWAGTIVFLTCGFYINTMPGWNPNSQFALTTALVERGTFSIDAYHAHPDYETGDKSFFEGHYYCDKSPLTPLLGTLPLAGIKLAARVFGFQPSVHLARYWTTWWTCGLAAALVAALLAWGLIARGAPPAAAARLAALFAVGTPLLAYSVTFYSYAPACELLLGGYLLIADAFRTGASLKFGRMLLAGVVVGLAVWSQQTIAVAALLITAALLAWGYESVAPQARTWERIRRLAPWAVGGVLGIAGFFIYSLFLFGEIASPYKFEADPGMRDAMAQGIMGATWPPKLMVALLITLRPYQGLFVWFPLATLAALGLLAQLSRTAPSGNRREAIVALAFLFGLILYNSAYYMWWGGWAYMPRHLIPALPLLGLGLLPWLTTTPRVRGWAYALGIAGAVISFSAVAFNPQHSSKLPYDVMLKLEDAASWPSPFANVLRLFWLRGMTQCPNWGTLLGLEGRTSLLPLLAIWAVGWVISMRLDRCVSDSVIRNTPSNS